MSTPLTKIKIVVSDLHLGAGHKKGAVNHYDEFTHDTELSELLEYYSSGDFYNLDVEFIINGDFFDFIKVKVGGEWHEKITEEIALDKLIQCMDGHPVVFNAIRVFLSRPNKSLTFMPGNHDVEMLFSSTARAFEERLTSPENRSKCKVVTDRDALILQGGIQIHHGHQFELNNSFDYNNLLVTRNFITSAPLDKPYLRLPWGTLFLLKVINPLKLERPYIDQIRPFSYYVKWGLLYDTRFMLKLLFRGAYYFVKSRLSLLREPTLTLKQAWRLIMDSIQFYPSLENYAERILKRVKGIRTVIMGHDHYERCRSFGADKLYINTGTWIKMINLDAPRLGQSQRHGYALVEYREGKDTPDVTLMEWQGAHKTTMPIWF